MKEREAARVIFSEDFELQFGTDNQDDDNSITPEKDEATVSVVETLGEEGIPTDQAKAYSVSHGYGADAMALGLWLGSAIGGVFLLGKQIDENITAWISIGKRLKKAIQKLRDKGVGVSMSEPLAAAYALALISEQAGTDEVELLSITIAQIRNGSLTREAYATFLQHPDRYYICAIQTNETVFVVGISASGHLLFQNRLSRSHFAYRF